MKEMPHQLDEAIVRDQARESPSHLLQDLLRVESLEVTVARRVEQHDDRHYFREAERRCPLSLARHIGQQSLLPEWFKEQAKVVYVTENG
jgi:hypothetical protein